MSDILHGPAMSQDTLHSCNTKAKILNFKARGSTHPGHVRPTGFSEGPRPKLKFKCVGQNVIQDQSTARKLCPQSGSFTRKNIISSVDIPNFMCLGGAYIPDPRLTLQFV